MSRHAARSGDSPPFLHAPFTIDDPIYLREAQHVLEDPLHPQAFNMVWSTDLNLRASKILPGVSLCLIC